MQDHYKKAMAALKTTKVRAAYSKVEYDFKPHDAKFVKLLAKELKAYYTKVDLGTFKTFEHGKYTLALIQNIGRKSDAIAICLHTGFVPYSTNPNLANALKRYVRNPKCNGSRVQDFSLIPFKHRWYVDAYVVDALMSLEPKGITMDAANVLFGKFVGRGAKDGKQWLHFDVKTKFNGHACRVSGLSNTHKTLMFVRVGNNTHILTKGKHYVTKRPPEKFFYFAQKYLQQDKYWVCDKRGRKCDW